MEHWLKRGSYQLGIFLFVSETYFQKQPVEVFYKNGVLKKFVKFTENTCARVSFLIKLLALPQTLLKRRLWHRFFPVDFAKFLRTPFLQNTTGRLLLYFGACQPCLMELFVKLFYDIQLRSFIMNTYMMALKYPSIFLLVSIIYNFYFILLSKYNLPFHFYTKNIAQVVNC